MISNRDEKTKNRKQCAALPSNLQVQGDNVYASLLTILPRRGLISWYLAEINKGLFTI